MSRYFLFLAVLAFPALGQTGAFNLQLNKTTEAELKRLYSVRPLGTNPNTRGNMFEVDVTTESLHGLKRLITVFEMDGTLEIIVAKMPSSLYGRVNQDMTERHELLSRDILPGGVMKAVFRDGKNLITLEAQRHSGNILLTFMTQDVADYVIIKSEANQV